MVFKCKMCGGTLNVQKDDTVCTCEYCGTKQTLPRLDDVKIANLYDRANHFRINNEFDKASTIYEQILSEDNSDCETYWSLVLCEYGVEYVEDPSSHKRIPTVNRTQFTSIYQNDNYKEAIRLANPLQKEVYENEAKQIDEIQKDILAISNNEEPFDIFICYKETDKKGGRTIDSVLAEEIYNKLIELNYKVFFARRTLEDKLGTEFEPYIFSALNSSKVMLVVGTSIDNFNAVWVKNEWSRYLKLIKNKGANKTLIPVYKSMEAYDLPDDFAILQAQSMDKVGAMQDLINGIGKIVKPGLKNNDIDEESYEKFKRMLEEEKRRERREFDKAKQKYEVAVKFESSNTFFSVVTFLLSLAMACFVIVSLYSFSINTLMKLFRQYLAIILFAISLSTFIAYFLGIANRKTNKISKYFYFINLILASIGVFVYYWYRARVSYIYYGIIATNVILFLLKNKWEIKEKIVFATEKEKNELLEKNKAIVNDSIKQEKFIVKKSIYLLAIVFLVASIIFNFIPFKSQSNKRDASVDQILILSDYIKLREDADIYSDVIGIVNKDEFYTYYDVKESFQGGNELTWYLIETSNGIKGYVSGGYKSDDYVRVFKKGSN